MFPFVGLGAEILIGYLIGSNVHGKHIHARDLIAPHSSDFDNDKVSATINDALTKAGYDADEVGAIRAGFHIAVDQSDEKEDESRKLLSDVLLKVLDHSDVEKVDGALDVLGEKADGLVQRDVEATAGPKDGVKPADHIVVTDSSDDLAARDLDYTSMAELMATMTLAEGHIGNAWMPGSLKDPRDEHAGKHDGHGSQPEKREESNDNTGPEPIEPGKEPERKDSPGPIDVDHPRPTPTEVLASHPLLAQFLDMGYLDNPERPRAATAEDVVVIHTLLSKFNNTKLPGSNAPLTDRDRAKLNFLLKLKDMGLLKKPKGKRIMTMEELFQAWQKYSLKANADRNETLPSDGHAPIEHERIPIPVEQASHSKRAVPEVPGCDCQSTIDAVKEPKPEGGMTYAWFQDWKHKDVNTNCIRPCVDKAIDHFDETVRKYQAFEKQFGAGLKRPSGLEKRNQPIDHPELAKAVPAVKNEPPKSVKGMTYRDWFMKTQETGEFCTCHMQSPSMWSWVLSFYVKSQRCIKFCSQSVKPFLEKEKETLPAPQEPSANGTAVEEPVVDSSPSGEKVPGVVSVPISEGPKTQPEQDTPGNSSDEQ
jgi:hypothetical protein